MNQHACATKLSASPSCTGGHGGVYRKLVIVKAMRAVNGLTSHPERDARAAMDRVVIGLLEALKRWRGVAEQLLHSIQGSLPPHKVNPRTRPSTNVMTSCGIS
ncbi:hypothetical protein [Aquincola tertiaricarbonis]|uniref:hypothetical protein n=1 Tax=Aquincola tertiaricarbonis TaxID=391953 RepID=UPI0012EECB26|nr:hypothetical protein [Aquincola tertiaricarbonis]